MVHTQNECLDEMDLGSGLTTSYDYFAQTGVLIRHKTNDGIEVQRQ